MSDAEAAGVLAYKQKKNDLPLKLAASLKLNHPKLLPPNMEYRFVRDIVGDEKGVRKRIAAAGLKDWRFDLAWPTYMIAAEVEGGAFVQGRHVQGAGFREDLIKYGWAGFYGWTVYRCDAYMIKQGLAAHQLSTILKRAIRSIEITEKHERSSTY